MKTLDAVSNFIAAAGGLILMILAAVVTSTLVVEALRTFRTFRALRQLSYVPALVTFIILLCSAARAESIVVTVDKTTQRLTVEVDGVTRSQWPISTARQGYRTPNGSYRPEWLARKWFSREYDWSPMPYSIFFSGGYAIHGSYEISRLGSPASHGCIRLHPENAAILFALVKRNMNSTQIEVMGEGSDAAIRAPRGARKSPTIRIERWENPVFY